MTEPTETFLRNESQVGISRAVHPQATGVLQVQRSVELFGNARGSVGFRSPATAYGPIYCLPSQDSTIGTAVMVTDATGNLSWSAAPTISMIYACFDGGGSAITAGTRFNTVVPWAFRILECFMVSEETGSALVSIFATDYANGQPSSLNTITSSATPAISSAKSARDTTLTGWTTTFASPLWMRFTVISVTTIQQLTLGLRVQKGDFVSGAGGEAQLQIGTPVGDHGVGAIATDVGGRNSGGDYGGPWVCR